MQFRVGIEPRTGLFTVGAALIGAAAFPPMGLWYLSLVSVCLLVYLLRDHSASESRGVGLLYGTVYGLGTMYWMFGIFGFLAISFVGLMAGYFGLMATLVGMTRGRRPMVRALLIAMIAIAVEWLRGDAWYLRFPWYTVPHALAAAPAWIAPARWVGVYGLSFLVWFIAALGCLKSPAYWLAFIFFPIVSLALPAVDKPSHRALLIQVEEPERIQPLLAEVPGEKVDLAVLPEYAYPYSVEEAIKSKWGPADFARGVSLKSLKKRPAILRSRPSPFRSCATKVPGPSRNRGITPNLGKSCSNQIAYWRHEHCRSLTHKRCGDGRRIEIVTDGNAKGSLLDRENRPAVAGSAVYHQGHRPLLGERADEVAISIEDSGDILEIWLAVSPLDRAEDNGSAEKQCRKLESWAMALSSACPASRRSAWRPPSSSRWNASAARFLPLTLK
jgi:hypothetical protein